MLLRGSSAELIHSRGRFRSRVGRLPNLNEGQTSLWPAVKMSSSASTTFSTADISLEFQHRLGPRPPSRQQSLPPLRTVARMPETPTSGSRVHLSLVFNHLSWSSSPSSPNVLQLENTSHPEGAAQLANIGDLYTPTYDPTELELSITSREIQRQAREKYARRLHPTNDYDSLRDLERATKFRIEEAAVESTRLDCESLHVLETATSLHADFRRNRDPVDAVMQQWLESEFSLGAATRFALNAQDLSGNDDLFDEVMSLVDEMDDFGVADEVLEAFGEEAEEKHEAKEKVHTGVMDRNSSANAGLEWVTFSDAGEESRAAAGARSLPYIPTEGIPTLSRFSDWSSVPFSGGSGEAEAKDAECLERT